jgi:hypothetical protein
MKSIFLPAAEDTRIEINCPSFDTPIVAELLDIDYMISAANDAKKKTGQTWTYEFCEMFDDKYDAKINTTQAYLIYEAVRDAIDTLKKKLSTE